MLRRKYGEIYYFWVPIQKELDNGKTITYKLKFIDNFRTSLSSLLDNLSEIYSKRRRDKKCESNCYFIRVKNKKLQYKGNEYKKRKLKPING